MYNGGEESFRKEAFFLIKKRDRGLVELICSMQVFAKLQDVVYRVQTVKNKGWMLFGVPKKA